MLPQELLKSSLPIVFLLLGEHEGTEFLKLGLEVGCVLLFLEVAQLGMLHRR
jgi:hypothetical protein